MAALFVGRLPVPPRPLPTTRTNLDPAYVKEHRSDEVLGGASHMDSC